MKFSVKVGNGSVNRWLNFGGDLDHGSGYSALAEVSTVPLLLVSS